MLSYQHAADHAVYAAAGWVALVLLVTVVGGATLLAMLPVTPAGLGVVEGVLIPAEDQHAASAWGSQYCLVERVDIGDRNGGGQAPRGNPRGPCPYT